MQEKREGEKEEWDREKWVRLGNRDRKSGGCRYTLVRERELIRERS